METEAWLAGRLEGFAPVVMPAAHALIECAKDLEKHALSLSREELRAMPGGAPSIAFHLRHIAGSIDRLLTYARNEQLTIEQFDFLKTESAPNSTETAAELIVAATNKINETLEALKNVSPEILFDARAVGRQKLPTNVFGLLFHIAEHTARHTGQIVTTAKIVRDQQH